MPSAVAVDSTSRYIFVANLEDNNISEYVLNPAAGPLAASGAGGLAIDPGARCLYVANSQDQSITLFDVNQSRGGLSLVGTVNAQQTGGFLASLGIDRTGNFPYAISAAGSIFEFQINPASDVLNPIGTVAASDAPWSMAFAS